MQPAPAPVVMLTPATRAAPTDGGTLDVLVCVQAPDRPGNAGVAVRHLRIKLTPATGVLPEVLGTAPRHEDSTYPLPDLAWGAQAWMLVRLHMAPMPTAYPQQLHALLAVTLDAAMGQGADPAQVNALLSLPLVQAGDLAGLPKDERVIRRLKALAAATACVWQRTTDELNALNP